MCEGESDAEAAGLGEDVGEVGGQVEDVLELVDEHHHRRSAAAALLGGLPQQGDDERADQRGGLRAQRAFGQRDQQDFRFGEHVVEGEGWFGLADDVADSAAQQKRAQLVHDRPDRLAPLGWAGLLVPGPERPQCDRIVHPGHEPSAEPVVGQQQRQLAQRHPGLLGEGEQ